MINRAVMKAELTPLVKYLKRKQRMFVIMAAPAVVLHKHYFSKQSKRLRDKLEIRHGMCVFWGGVHRLALTLEGGEVQSEDDEFWDKRFLFMRDVYNIRIRALQESGELKEDDEFFVHTLIENLCRPYILLPNGDMIMIDNRTNPSGADATTENNCIARKLVENYMRILHARGLSKADPRENLKGTHFYGDDRTANLKHYHPGFGKFYAENVSRCGVRLKTLVTTNGPVGSEFCGFKITRSHWDSSYYVPHYNLERLIAGLCIPIDKDVRITFIRFMAFALLYYPHKPEYTALRPIVIAFCQLHPQVEEAQLAIDFWSDEAYLRSMWDGREAVSGRLFNPDTVSKAIECAQQFMLPSDVEAGGIKDPDV